MTRRRAAHGFTLIEVLTALAVLAIVLPVAMKGISLATRASGHARRQATAVSLAQDTLSGMVADGSWNGSVLSGDFEDAPGFSWSAEVSDWSDVALRELTVSVHWTEAGQERGVSLTTLVPSPTVESAL